MVGRATPDDDEGVSDFNVQRLQSAPSPSRDLALEGRRHAVK
jgi:hypothetical protein